MGRKAQRNGQKSTEDGHGKETGPPVLGEVWGAPRPGVGQQSVDEAEEEPWWGAGSLGSYRRSFALLDCRRSYKSDKRGASLQTQEQPSAGDVSDRLITAACCKQAVRALPLIRQLLMLQASKKRQLLSYTLNPLSGLR